MTGEWTYADALDALSRAGRFGVNPSLSSAERMVDALDLPHNAYTCIQVTGTNGKSSTARLIAAILSSHGVSCGLYTSPELHAHTERIEINGASVSETEFARAVKVAVQAARIADVDATEFELSTVAALWLYRERGVEFAVLEVGMGGRWDATSVVSPSVAVITGVGLDHTEHLGSTRSDIAFDKAHIIKPASSVVLGPGTAGVDEVVLARSRGYRIRAWAVRQGQTPSPVPDAVTVRFDVRARPRSPDGATALDVSGVHAPYPELEVHSPVYQAANVATAVAAAEAALGRPLERSRVRCAVASTRFPGRFEVVSRNPWIVVDGAHNPEAAAVLATAIVDAWPDAARRPVALLGILSDKDAGGVVAALAPVINDFVCVTPDSPRALSGSDLARVVERHTGEKAYVGASVEEGALRALKDSEGRGVLATGSIRTAAQVAAWAAGPSDTIPLV